MVKAPVPKPIKNTGSPGTDENLFRECKNWNSFTIVRACKSVLREREDSESEKISRQKWEASENHYLIEVETIYKLEKIRNN